MIFKQNINEEAKHLFTTKTPESCPSELVYVNIMPHMESISKLFYSFSPGTYIKENEHDPLTVFFTETSHYRVHYKRFSSWTDAEMTCNQQYNMSLLKINTDLEAKLIMQYLQITSLHPVCPVLFLDMQVSNKVRKAKRVYLGWVWRSSLLQTYLCRNYFLDSNCHLFFRLQKRQWHFRTRTLISWT